MSGKCFRIKIKDCPYREETKMSVIADGKMETTIYQLCNSTPCLFAIERLLLSLPTTFLEYRIKE